MEKMKIVHCSVALDVHVTSQWLCDSTKTCADREQSYIGRCVEQQEDECCLHCKQPRVCTMCIVHESIIASTKKEMKKKKEKNHCEYKQERRCNSRRCMCDDVSE